MVVVPLTLRAANAFVERLHRHHGSARGHKLSIGIAEEGILRGVAILGRPVARMLDDGQTIEVLRLCTDGISNGCSKLYGAARRIAKEMGYARIITYTLPEEGGASLKASGYVFEGEAGGGSWSRPSRKREDSHPIGIKHRWVCKL